jgi:SPP1 gp7 family putative phage head morphogenesis protein
MNSEQLRLFINGAFGSEADAKRVTKLLTPYLARALQEIRDIVDLLPDDSLRRQAVWREMEPQITAALGPYNDAFFAQLDRQLPLSGLGAAEETIGMMRSVGVPMAGVLPAELVMAESTKYLLNTKINNKRVVDMFLSRTGKPSPFTVSNRRMIDSIVTGGIIKGSSTADIARAIRTELPKRMQSQAVAIARTSIQDYNRQVKEEVWTANQDAFTALGLKYEWVSALDSRTCQTCAPLDGRVKDKKADFPSTPVHVNCRCQVVLIDPDDPGSVRFGQDAYDTKPSGPGAYKTKKAVKGEELYRKNREVATVNGRSPRYADFLASSNRTTQAMFFGGGNAGAVRAERFRRYIKNGKTPQQALIDLTNRVPNTKADRRFKPVAD